MDFGRSLYAGRSAAALAILALIPACAGPAPIPRLEVEQETNASALTIRGDWDDVSASVATGASRAEMTMLASETTPERVEFRLQTLGGEAGILTATPLEPPPPPPPRPSDF